MRKAEPGMLTNLPTTSTTSHFLRRVVRVRVVCLQPAEWRRKQAGSKELGASLTSEQMLWGQVAHLATCVKLAEERRCAHTRTVAPKAASRRQRATENPNNPTLCSHAGAGT